MRTIEKKWGKRAWERCVYLVLVEIGLLHFSQGVFQVGEHKLLNLAAVGGPHFLDSYADTDASGRARETNT